MRNTNEYPITLEEKLDALDWAIREAQRHEADSCGGTLALCLQEVRKQFKNEFE